MWRRHRRKRWMGSTMRSGNTSIARPISTSRAVCRQMRPRRQVRLAFGNVALVQEDARAAWTWGWFEQMRQDLRFGACILTNSRGLSFTAAVLIALVIGINTTIFSMVNSLVTCPAPGVSAEGLVRIALAGRPGAPFVSYPDYLDYTAQTTTLRSLTAFTNGRITMTSDAGNYALMASAVDAELFRHGRHSAGARPHVHLERRALDNAAELVAIVSYRAWQDLFGGAEDIVGRKIAVNNLPATVIGVVPPNFRGTMLAERADVWLPLLMYWALSRETRQRWITERSETPVDLIGRLASGGTWLRRRQTSLRCRPG